MLKLPEVAQRLGVSEKTARRYIKAGTIPSVFIGNAYRVREEDLAEYMHQAQVTPGGVVVPKGQAPPDRARSIYDLAWESLNRQAAQEQQAANRALESSFAQVSFRNHKSDARILLEQYSQAELAAAYVDLMESYLEAERALQERQRAPDEAGKSSP